MFSQIHHSIQGRHIQFFCLTHIEFRIGDLRRTSTKPRIYMNVQVWVQTREGKHYETNGYISNTRTRNRNRQKQSSVTCKWVLAQLRYTWRSHPSTSEFQQRSCIESPSACSSYVAPLSLPSPTRFLNLLHPHIILLLRIWIGCVSSNINVRRTKIRTGS